MLNVSQINHIKDLARSGKRLSEIVRETKRDAKTVRKYLKEEDFSPRPPNVATKPSKLDSYKPTIDEWLKSDEMRWHKQQHTAKRIYDRLKQEFNEFDGSYPTVVRYVRERRHTLKQVKCFQELVWHPGEAQVDFGEADFEERQHMVRKKYLTVSFPHSNDSFTQVFSGETAECVCQGLQDIFAFIGGVPNILIFDNATGVGRRVGEKISEAKLFAQFRAHYNFAVRFCNPDSGHEKGNVENKIGYTRHNLFVPPLSYLDIVVFNRDLLEKHQIKANEVHYKKLVPIKKLFEEDKKALRPLPTYPFNVCRYETVTADAYGKVCLDGRHRYATCPEYGGQPVLVGLRAHCVEILTKDLEILTVYERRYSDQRTDSSDYRTMLATLMRNVGAWPNSGIREQMPAALRLTMDAQPREELRQSLRALQQLSDIYDFETAIGALDESLRLDRTRFCDRAVLAARIHGYGLMSPPEQGPDLRVYDHLLMGGENVCDT
jgi:transposase